MTKTMTKTNDSRDILSEQAERPSYLEINLDALKHNISLIRKGIGKKVRLMAVVKANAYGHGLLPVAAFAQKCGVDMLGVALIEEAEKLIKAGISIPIVILYPDLVERAARIANSTVIATVDSADYLQALNEAASKYNRKIQVFLKFETGMGRFGADADNVASLFALAQNMASMEVVGISTNLADSSNGDDSFTRGQFAKFKELCDKIRSEKPEIICSIENSSGFVYHHNDSFDMVRIGLAMYGIAPRENIDYGFKPVMSLKSRIIQLKRWPAGAPVGYGGTFVPQRDSVIATIGLGYADGYPWVLSNKGPALINGQRVQIAGKVCMDAIMLDVTDIQDPAIGDEVVLMGESGDKQIIAPELARMAGSFSYELISGFSDRLPRIYRGE